MPRRNLSEPFLGRGTSQEYTLTRDQTICDQTICVNPEIMALAHALGPPSLHLSTCIGPCLKPLFALAMFHFILPIMACVYTAYFSECQPGQTFVTFSPIVYGFIFILFCGHALLEFLFFRYSSLPYYAVVQKWAVFGISVSQFKWIVVSFSLSAVSFVGMVTPSLFSGAVFALEGTKFCGHLQRKAIWHKTIKDSEVLKPLFLLLDQQPDAAMSTIVWSCWFLQFGPLIYFVLTACPLTPRQLSSNGRNWAGEEYGTDLSFDVPKTREEYFSNERRYYYLSLWSHMGGIQITSSSFYALAEAVGMNSISGQALSYPFAKLSALTTGLKEAHLSATREVEEARMCMNHLVGLHHRMMVRVFFSGLLGSGLQLQIQISFFAMSLATRKEGDADTSKSMIEAIVAISVAFLKCIQVISSLMELRAAHEQLDELMDCIDHAIMANTSTHPLTGRRQRFLYPFRIFLMFLMAIPRTVIEWYRYFKALFSPNDTNVGGETARRRMDEMRQKVRKYRSGKRVLWLGAIMFILNIIWALFKFAAAFYCPGHMFDWSSNFTNTYGCVDLTMFKCFKEKTFNVSIVHEGGCPWTDPCCNWDWH
eukprot:NODE_2643_length_2173_cov_13.615836.p1 GENE.NODE_2643_length_2173_cov_13.615836~~NODE_2643_length_2173_cov_13.615836.p1  ORF type:complete len:594 (+),score=57.50 NODE_2643_length_2173_cov_13.615836:136-1917(+)